MAYKLTTNDKTRFICLVLLNEIIQFQHYFEVKSQGNDFVIRPYLETMAQKGLLRIEGDKYVPTAQGREELVNLYAKYQEYLKLFDIFCAVDLERGEFAFSSINNDWSDDEWFAFLDEERFSDVRVAVADFKGINPLEIVFMSFLNEGRLECNPENRDWQFELTSDDLWNEIEEICNTAVTREYLEQDGVLEDVIRQGTEIAIRLVQEAEASLNAPETIVEEEVIEETVVEETEEYVDVVEMPVYGYSYYQPYYDPFYISPIWVAAAVVLW